MCCMKTREPIGQAYAGSRFTVQMATSIAESVRTFEKLPQSCWHVPSSSDRPNGSILARTESRFVSHSPFLIGR